MPLSPLTVIVVDDDVDIRRAVGRLLRSYGHRVYLFESGEEYLAQHCDGDCAIVDIGLPGVSGLEMAERLRECGRGMPVVFITAHDDLANRASRRTRMPVLKKPLEECDLLAAIDQIARPASASGGNPVTAPAPGRSRRRAFASAARDAL